MINKSVDFEKKKHLIFFQIQFNNQKSKINLFCNLNIVPAYLFYSKTYFVLQKSTL